MIRFVRFRHFKSTKIKKNAHNIYLALLINTENKNCVSYLYYKNIKGNRVVVFECYEVKFSEK